MPGFRQTAQLLSIGPWGSQGRGLEEVLGWGWEWGVMEPSASQYPH